MRLAWFSPLPPSTSGIAAYSAELLPLLRQRGFEIETFTENNAHDFVWTRRRHPFDLTVYQLGNAACHDFMWAYLFRYPGLVVLHDIQLHQARALFLTKRWQPRLDDYAAEVRANHPDAPADLPYLVIARMGDRMYQHWPMVRLVIERAAMTLVHNTWVAADLRAAFPTADVHAMAMGVPEPRPTPALSPLAVRRRHHVPEDAFLIAAFGGLTPEKRLPQVIRAIAASGDRHARTRLMLVGNPAAHYDVKADAAAAGLADRIVTTGFVDDEELPSYLLAADVCACLRWPTNRETSASWLRCLAAGRPTLITELAHLGDVPSLDPRGWRVVDTAAARREPITVCIDPLDEEHSLQLALDRLAGDRALRTRLGTAAHAWWQAHHRLDSMADAYAALLPAAAAAPAGSPALPRHLLDDGGTVAQTLTEDYGVRERLRDLE
jgi:glycosyltransferase involved in cell wall biosynthesis